MLTLFDRVSFFRKNPSLLIARLSAIQLEIDTIRMSLQFFRILNLIESVDFVPIQNNILHKSLYIYIFFIV